MKRLILAGIVALAAIASVQVSAPQAGAAPIDCSTVKCMACPEGYVFAPTQGNCCRCVRI